MASYPHRKKGHWTPRPHFWNDDNSLSGIRKKLEINNARSSFADILLTNMTPGEINSVLTRATKKDKSKNISQLDKARMLRLAPTLKSIYDPTELSLHYQIALASWNFDEFIEYVDVNKLTRYQIKLLFEAGSKCVNYLMQNLNKETMQKSFSLEMWEKGLRAFPRKASYFNITKIRNQTDLRRFVKRRPSILKYATLDDLKDCIIDAPTWVRIATEMAPSRKKFFPVGFQNWAEKEMFKLRLTGRKFKPFKSNWRDGLA